MVEPGSSGTSEADDSTTDGDSFLDPTDSCGPELPDGVLAHCSPVECSVYEQDCNEGETCRAWANDGGSRWNAFRCSPVAERPAQVGEPCTVEGGPLSGVDSCDVGLMCWDVDPETLEGECAAYCSGSPLEPSCDEQEDACFVLDEHVPLCRPPCDPLANECEAGSTCAWSPDDVFACVDQAVVPCPDGHRYYGAGQGPAAFCGEDEPCCLPYCDTSQAEPCPDMLNCLPFHITPNPDHPMLGLCWPL